VSNIDRADWHYGGDYPSGLPPENGGTHIGMYLAWVIHRQLGSKTLAKYGGGMFQRVLDRQATGRDLLFTELDEKFFPELLNKEGKAFTRDYYESNEYINDYDQVLGDTLESLYHVEDNWDNYDKVVPVLDQRLEAWRNARARSASTA
jgi:hypothetical protein